MRNKLKRQETQMAMGKSDDGIVPRKSGNSDGGKAVTSTECCRASNDRTQRRNESVQTRLQRISERAKKSPTEVFNNLYQHLDLEMLEWAFEQLDADKAPGVDGVTKADYAEDLQANLQQLAQWLARGSYRPWPTRRRYIPKANGKLRPLGIPTLQSKIVEKAVAALLQQIYEEKFHDFSFGFRPGRSCHDALDRLRRHIYCHKVRFVVEADIQGFYDNVDHDWLLRLLAHRVSDPRMLRLIRRFLKAGVLDGGKRLASEKGTPQGGVISPLLANIYLHYVLDKWFAKEVQARCRGKAHLVRYADDFVVCFEYEEDAQNFLTSLEERLGQFGLKTEPSKTKMIRFGRFAQRDCADRGETPQVFDFLGFTHYCGRNRHGRFKLKLRTAGTRLRAKVRAMKDWLRSHRTLPIKELWAAVKLKLQGHYRYFGVQDNIPALASFYRITCRLLFLWLNRRSQRKSFTWKSWYSRLRLYPLPAPRVYVKFPFGLSATGVTGSRMQ